MAKAKERWCGFCGKRQDEVVTMVEGPCINVCNECVDAMHELVHAPKPLLPVKPAAKSKTVLSFQEEARKRGRR